MALLIDKNKPKSYNNYDKHVSEVKAPVSKTKSSMTPNRRKSSVKNPGRPRKDGDSVTKLNEEQVLTMRRLNKEGVPLREICKQFPDISYNHVHQVIKRMYWKNI